MTSPEKAPAWDSTSAAVTSDLTRSLAKTELSEGPTSTLRGASDSASEEEEVLDFFLVPSFLLAFLSLFVFLSDLDRVEEAKSANSNNSSSSSNVVLLEVFMMLA